MWTTVLLLGLAVSIEPARVGSVALLLTKKRPARHLLVFLCTGLGISLSVGLAVLFVFHHSFLGDSFLSHPDFNPALIQIGIGVFALLLAAPLASNLSLPQFARRPSVETSPVDAAALVLADPPAPGRMKRLLTRIRGFVQGDSSWFSGFVGVALAMPSVDYMALLVLIIASKTSPLAQASALMTFLLITSAVVILPLLSFLVAPGKTRAWVQRFNEWIRTRTRRHAAAFVAVVGTVLIGVGLISL
ncbi:hypothetical protein B1R94_15655 [Mycolicibacterium litorale]|nr:hypothetical protein B1R94_15655 [Mycolicibacterium litorale]